MNGCFLRFGARELRTQLAANAYAEGLWHAKVWLNERRRAGRRMAEAYGLNTTPPVIRQRSCDG